MIHYINNLALIKKASSQLNAAQISRLNRFLQINCFKYISISFLLYDLRLTIAAFAVREHRFSVLNRKKSHSFVIFLLTLLSKDAFQAPVTKIRLTVC